MMAAAGAGGMVTLTANVIGQCIQILANCMHSHGGNHGSNGAMQHPYAMMPPITSSDRMTPGPCEIRVARRKAGRPAAGAPRRITLKSRADRSTRRLTRRGKGRCSAAWQA